VQCLFDERNNLSIYTPYDWRTLYIKDYPATNTRSTMFDPKMLDDLTSRFTSLLPAGAVEFQRDLEKNIRAIFSSALAKMDLVTREEFEVQKALLERTQDRMMALERQLEAVRVDNSKVSIDKDDGATTTPP
jgi:hypothetical protein